MIFQNDALQEKLLLTYTPCRRHTDMFADPDLQPRWPHFSCETRMNLYKRYMFLCHQKFKMAEFGIPMGKFLRYSFLKLLGQFKANGMDGPLAMNTSLASKKATISGQFIMRTFLMSLLGEQCRLTSSPFISSPDPKGQVSYCHHEASVVRR